MDNYILINKTPVEEPDIIKWSEWFEEATISGARIIKQDHLTKYIYVSTVFLGLNHSWAEDQSPLLFETMIFGGKEGDYQQRYSTWTEAENGHKVALKLAVRNLTIKEEFEELIYKIKAYVSKQYKILLGTSH